MTLLDAYRRQLKTCQVKGLSFEAGHYQTKVDFGGKDVYVSPDGKDVIRYKFSITGCLKARIIKKEGKTKVLHFHKDRLPVYGTITRRKSLKGFLYKYLLFLRCDGIEDPELIKLYLLHCLTYKFEYWRKVPMTTIDDNNRIVVVYRDWEMYEPDHSDVARMIDGLISSAMKIEIDDQTRERFIVRTRCVVNDEVRDEFGGFRDKYKSEKHRDARRGCRAATDNKIWAIYDPRLKEEDLARKAGVSIGRVREWKADHKDELESLKDRINRLYDESLSPRQNAEVIGCSVNSVRKYAEKLKAPKEETEDAWIGRVLEEESSAWADVPSVKKKNSDEWDDMMDLLDNLD